MEDFPSACREVAVLTKMLWKRCPVGTDAILPERSQEVPYFGRLRHAAGHETVARRGANRILRVRTIEQGSRASKLVDVRCAHERVAVTTELWACIVSDYEENIGAPPFACL